MDNNNSKQRTYLMMCGALEIIRHSLKMISSGIEPFYRVIAVQLRLLLCDTTRRHGNIVDLSLLPQILPDLKLCEIDGSGYPRSDRASLSIKEWLQQKIILDQSSPMTIREFIRQICDQDGGAHYDPKYNRAFDQSNTYRQTIAKLSSYLIQAASPELIQKTLWRNDHET